jgi:hypothetical protein
MLKSAALLDRQKVDRPSTTVLAQCQNLRPISKKLANFDNNQGSLQYPSLVICLRISEAAVCLVSLDTLLLTEIPQHRKL